MTTNNTAAAAAAAAAARQIRPFQIELTRVMGPEIHLRRLSTTLGGFPKRRPCNGGRVSGVKKYPKLAGKQNKYC